LTLLDLSRFLAIDCVEGAIMLVSQEEKRMATGVESKAGRRAKKKAKKKVAKKKAAKKK